MQVSKLEEELAAAQATLRLTHQPHSFLLEQLQASKKAKHQLESRMERLQEALQVRVIPAAFNCLGRQQAMLVLHWVMF